jgi:hypothetical protein
MRQVSKTTLAQQLVARTDTLTTVFDLENHVDLAWLGDPMLALFPALRMLADRPQSPTQFLVLWSASTMLRQQVSESLAGRIYYHELGEFALSEILKSCDIFGTVFRP